MDLQILEKMKLKCLERALIEKLHKLEAKRNKSLLDYVMYLEIIKECREIQEQIFALQDKREALSPQQLEELIAEYRSLSDMPEKDFFMKMNVGGNNVK